jgi:hypothetical protein
MSCKMFVDERICSLCHSTCLELISVYNSVCGLTNALKPMRLGSISDTKYDNSVKSSSRHFLVLELGVS